MRRAVVIGLLALYFIACAEKSVNSGPDSTVQKTVYNFTLTPGQRNTFSIPEIRLDDMPIIQIYCHIAIQCGGHGEWHGGSVVEIMDGQMFLSDFGPCYDSLRVVVIR